MQLNVKEFLDQAGIEEAFYPGKRLVQSYRQPGEYKSHCVVLDWRDPGKIRIEIKAGLSGRSLEPKKLKDYPVCFQSPTYVDVEIINDNEDDEKKDEEEEEGKSGSGKGGSGGKQPKKKSLVASAFENVIEGAVPELGKIVDMMVMGTQIAKEAYGKVLGAMAQQMEHGKIIATDLFAKAGDFVTKYEPPSFMKAKGDETASYSYDREKNADIGFRQSIG